MYDYLVVGSGLFGATFAYLAKKKGLKVLVIEKESVTGGGIRTERRENIDIHIYGPHIFHTSSKETWDFISSLVTMNSFVNEPLAYYQGKYFHLPFNMNTFQAMWGISEPEKAKEIIQEQRAREGITEPKNLEEQALSLVGRDIYEILIKGYSEKQWGRDCKDLPPDIIKRLPLRFTYDNNYFNDTYQGIPVEGYTALIDRLLEGIEVRVNCDYLKEREKYNSTCKRIIYTGEIDKLFNYSLGHLEYRTLRFEVERKEVESFQGNAVVNYTERQVPYTRICEHKFFVPSRKSPVTYITKEYPKEFENGDMPFYPINNSRNDELYSDYLKLNDNPNLFFGGRLGSYKYFDMDDTIMASKALFERLEG